MSVLLITQKNRYKKEQEKVEKQEALDAVELGVENMESILDLTELAVSLSEELETVKAQLKKEGEV